MNYSFVEKGKVKTQNIDDVKFDLTADVLAVGAGCAGIYVADSASRLGKKVILIDCDLRHPTGRLIFDMPQSTGLTEYLKGELDLLDYIDQAKEENSHEYPNFLFLPGGSPVADGSHLLSSPRMKDLITCVKTKADYVILDCAPAGLLTDPAVLAKYADSALLVIRKDFARIDFISEALAHLSESNIQLIGGVLNDVQV